jgi:Homeodomain-like domain-containing protein
LATATQTLESAQTAQSIPNWFTVCIVNELLRDLAAMHEAVGGERAVSLGTFVSQLVEERIVHFRSLRIKPSLDATSFNAEDEETPSPGNHYIHKCLLSTEQKQQILFLRDEGMSVDDLAKRFHCGRSTIRRILAAYDERAHNPSALQPGPNRKHGDPEAW